jgi:hypothetical protein
MVKKINHDEMSSYLFEIVFESDFEQSETTVRVSELLVYLRQFELVFHTHTFQLFACIEKLVQLSLRTNQLDYFDYN